MKPQSDYIVGSMIGLLEAISGYNGTDEALGYTVYYYLTNMEASTLATSKLISVDGVMPSNETIANGDYKLVNEFYVVMRADEAFRYGRCVLVSCFVSLTSKSLMGIISIPAKMLPIP